MIAYNEKRFFEDIFELKNIAVVGLSQIQLGQVIMFQNIC